MPTKPKIVTLTNSSVEILNAIRNSASTNYSNYVPVATDDAESLRTIGAIIMDEPQLQNEFINALVNRIAMVLVTSKSYQNPWAIFKKGVVELGEKIEEVFVELAKPFQFDPALAETTLLARQIPDVKSAFHVCNYRIFYKVTVSREQLKTAFLSWSGVTDLISKIVDSMYTAASYDEFLVMKYMLARRILAGQMHVENVSASDGVVSDYKELVSKVKSTSNKFTFMSPNYNLVGVRNHADKNKQYVLINADYDALLDVEVLAAAFNMSKAEFMGQRILVDGFGEVDNDRLDELFDGDDTYEELSDDEIAALNAIPCVLVDSDFFMIFDNLNQLEDVKNGQGLYWNYFYHVWRTFSTSPFANCAVFVPGSSGITSVTVSPEAVTASMGQRISFGAVVAVSGFASQVVEWTVDATSAAAGVTVSPSGVVSIPDGDDPDTDWEITVTATSVVDTSKYDTATITVPAPEAEGGGGVAG